MAEERSGVTTGRRWLRRAAAIAAGVAAALPILVYLGVSYSIASGLTTGEREPLEDHPSAYGLEFEDVSFPSRRGDVVLKGWHMRGRGDRPSVIFVHGITANRASNEMLGPAARLVERGFSVLMFDQRAHGESGGDRTTYGVNERLDALGAFDFLVQRGAPPGSVGLFGMSMGAGTAVMAAADEPAIEALVADSPYADAADLIVNEVDVRTDVPRWIIPLFVPGSKLIAGAFFGIDVGKLTPEEAAARIEYPILVLHGEADTRIPPDHGRRVRDAAHPDSGFWLVPGAEHGDAFETFPDEYVRRVAGYFEERLGGR